MLSTQPAGGRVRLRDRAVARIRAFAETAQMQSINTSLPISFGGLIVGLGYFMAAQPEPTLQLRFSNSFTAAFGIMSLVLVLVLSFDLARRRGGPIALGVITSFAAFAISLPYDRATSFATLMKALGSSGLFLAIGIALLTDAALAFAQRRFGVTPGAIAAAVLIIAVAGALALGHVSLTAGLDAAIAPIGDLGDSLTALLIITAVETLLWTVGIHGPALLAPVLLPIYANLQMQNSNAFGHEHALPHIVTVSIFLFVFPGGAGATLPLVLLLLRSKVKRLRRVAIATLLPSLANSNEPLIFGLPLVLNPVLGVPFVVAPLVLAVVTWWAMNLNFASKTIYYIPYLVPVPIGAYVATSDVRDALLALVDLGIAAAIYAPFVAIYERHELAREHDAVSL